MNRLHPAWGRIYGGPCAGHINVRGKGQRGDQGGPARIGSRGRASAGCSGAGRSANTAQTGSKTGVLCAGQMRGASARRATGSYGWGVVAKARGRPAPGHSEELGRARRKSRAAQGGAGSRAGPSSAQAKRPGAPQLLLVRLGRAMPGRRAAAPAPVAPEEHGGGPWAGFAQGVLRPAPEGQWRQRAPRAPTGLLLRPSYTRLTLSHKPLVQAGHGQGGDGALWGSSGAKGVLIGARRARRRRPQALLQPGRCAAGDRQRGPLWSQGKWPAALGRAAQIAAGWAGHGYPRWLGG
jgi:hypothetical protein